MIDFERWDLFVFKTCFSGKEKEREKGREKGEGREGERERERSERNEGRAAKQMGFCHPASPLILGQASFRKSIARYKTFNMDNRTKKMVKYDV